MLLPAGASTCMVHLTGNPIYDAVGSITISGLLGCTAIFLIQQNRSLLLGKPSGILKDYVMSVLSLAAAVPACDRGAARLLQHDGPSQELILTRKMCQYCLACDGLA